MAAGVRVRAEAVAALAPALQAEAARRLTPGGLRPQLRLEDEVELDALTPDVVNAIRRMAPFGEGNPRPRLATTPVELVDEPRVVGRTGTHLQFTVRQQSVYRKAIGFGLGAQASTLAEHRRLRVAFEPIINEWNGQRKVELKVVEWKPA
jgi:single-stranded-DNA-specific exonuclease